MFVATFQYQFTKDSLNYASPFVVMGLRYFLVGLVFYFLSGRKLPLDRDSITVALLASTSTIFWAFGLKYVSPGDSAVLSYTMPLFSIPLAYLIIKENVSTRELAGALVGFSGVVLYSLTLAHGSLLVGAVLTVINAVFWAAYSVYYRKLKDRDVLALFSTQFLLGSIPIIAGAVFFPVVVPTENFLIDMIYVVVFTGLIQYYLWNGMLRRGRVGRITTMAFAVPATSILVDAIRSDALPSYLSIAGAGIMFLGIFVSSWNRGAPEMRALTKKREAEN